MASYNDFFDYNNLKSFLMQSEQRKVYIQKRNIRENDVMMFLSSRVLNSVAKIIYTNRNLAKSSDTSIQEACGTIMPELKKGIFDSVNYFEETIASYNSQFSSVNSLCHDIINPLLVNDGHIDFEFSKDQSVSSNLECHAKIMNWSNKATKILSLLKRYTVEQTCNMALAINAKNYRNDIDKTFSTSKKDYESTLLKLANLTKTTALGEKSLNTKFLNLYQTYIAQKITLEELKSNDAYKKMSDLFYHNNPKNCYIDMERIYQYLAFDHSVNALYLIKNFHFKRAFKEYATLQKGKEHYKARVTKTTDTSISDSDIKGNTYNQVVSFVLQRYNAPIRCHMDAETINRLEMQYGIELEEKQIYIPFRSSISYKLSPKQAHQIGALHCKYSSRNIPCRARNLLCFFNQMQFAITDFKDGEPYQMKQGFHEKSHANTLEIPNEVLTATKKQESDDPCIG